MPADRITAWQESSRTAEAWSARRERIAAFCGGLIERHQDAPEPTVPDVPHNRLTFGPEELRAVADVVCSGHWAAGPRLAELERAFAEHARVTWAVGVGSGLAALRLALKGLGVGPGDEVIVPAYSCVALANAPLALVATPVPVDVRDLDWNLDPRAARRALTPRTRAVISVNTFGAPAPVEELRDLNVPIVEDCAHGFALDPAGRPVADRSDAAVLSLRATKLIGGGEGGAVLTNRRELADFVRAWRDYADHSPDPTRLNDNMTDLEAALALCQLRRLSAALAARSRLAQRYHACLAREAERTGAFRVPPPSASRVWYRYVVEVTAVPAATVVERLHRRGIRAERPVTDWRPPGAPTAPLADCAYQRLVSLPLYPALEPHEQAAVCAAFTAVLRELSDA